MYITDVLFVFSFEFWLNSKFNCSSIDHRLRDDDYILSYSTQIDSTTAFRQLFLSNVHINVMLTGFVLKLIDLLERCFLTFSCFLLLLLVFFISSSHSTSISTFNHLSSSNQFQFMSNNSYRNYLLRQYFIDLLNISDASLIGSMIYDRQQTSRTVQSNISSFVSHRSLHIV